MSMRFSRMVAAVVVSGCVCWTMGASSISAQEVAESKFDLIRNLVYVQRGDLPLKADVYQPHGSGPFPGVIVVHYGAWEAGNKARMSTISERLAEHGYTAVSINYRLAPKYQFPAQIEDCKAAVRWMRSNADKYRIDSAHIGGYGYSSGGQLVCLLGTTDKSCGLEGPDAAEDAPSTRLQCVVAGGAPCEFRLLPADSTRLTYFFGGTRAEKPELYEMASPLKYVTKDAPPMFLYHGETDAMVPVESSEAMAEKLQAAGVRTELYKVPHAGHVASILDERATTKAIDFLDQQLKQK